LRRFDQWPASHLAKNGGSPRPRQRENASDKISQPDSRCCRFLCRRGLGARRYIPEKPYGMVGWSTGPTGSGQDRHALRAIKRNQRPTKEQKIVTIEETGRNTSLRGITQIPVNEKKGLTLARGLALHSLRHDPLTRIIGRRNPRTTENAPKSLSSRRSRGHSRYSPTVHAKKRGPTSLGAFINMGVRALQFVFRPSNCMHGPAGLFEWVWARWLQEAQAYSPEELKKAGLDPAVWVTVNLPRGGRRPECSGTGYHGAPPSCGIWAGFWDRRIAK